MGVFQVKQQLFQCCFCFLSCFLHFYLQVNVSTGHYLWRQSASCFVGGANDENYVFSPLAQEKNHLTHSVKCAASAWLSDEWGRLYLSLAGCETACVFCEFVRGCV